MRSLIIKCIMVTNMARHNESVTQARLRVKDLQGAPLDLAVSCVLAVVPARVARTLRLTPGCRGRREPDRCLVAQMAMKCGDLAHVIRPFPVAKEWEDLIQTEFFLQGTASTRPPPPPSPPLVHDCPPHCCRC